MTKWGGFAVGASRHHIADFHLRIVDDDAINEQFHQLSALSKCQVVECRMHALAKCLDPLGQSRNIDVLLGLGIELPQLLPQAMLGLGHLLAFAFEFLTLDHLRQVQIEQPRLLAFKLREDVTQRLASRLQGLGQPCAHLRPLQFMGESGWAPARRGRGPARRVHLRLEPGHSGPCSARPGPAAAHRCGHDRSNNGSRGSRCVRCTRADTGHT